MEKVGRPAAEMNFDLDARRGQPELRAARDACDSHDHSLASLTSQHPCWPQEFRRPAACLGLGLAFELSDALFERFQPRARALQHLALRIEFVAAGQIELAEVGAQHRPEVVFEVFAQTAGTGCEPGRQTLHQAAEQFFDSGYLHWRLS